MTFEAIVRQQRGKGIFGIEDEGDEVVRQAKLQRGCDRLYLQVDGYRCPTREPCQSADDQGYREAKAVLAFSAHSVSEVSKEQQKSCPRFYRHRLSTVRCCGKSFTGSISRHGVRWPRK